MPGGRLEERAAQVQVQRHAELEVQLEVFEYASSSSPIPSRRVAVGHDELMPVLDDRELRDGRGPPARRGCGGEWAGERAP